MDTSTTPTPSTPLQAAAQPTVSFLPKSPNRRWLLWLAGGLAILAFGIALGAFGVKFLNQKQNQPPLALTPTLTPSPTPTPTPNPTGDWKIYTNTQYKYSFKYPADWVGAGLQPGSAPFPIDSEADSVLQSVEFYPNGLEGAVIKYPRFAVEVDDPVTNQSLGSYSDWINELRESQFYKVTNESQQLISGVNVISLEGPYTQGNIITYHKNYFAKSPDNKFFVLITDDEKDQKNATLFDQILSTFKFLD